ncbi:MAG: thioredoxin [Firmicutes bacterium]|nr:thioredoxin [Bacillota bacterium]
MIKELQTESFEQEIKEGRVLVDFYATWCGPCKMMHPVIEKLAEEHQDIKVIKIDVDQHNELAREFGVMSIPTIILFEDGEQKEKNVGFTSLETIERWFS